MEENKQAITLSESEQEFHPWTIAKLDRARRMLLKGQSIDQIGHSLRLSQAQKDELAIDSEDALEAKPELETHEEWRKRKSKEVERTVVTIVERHLNEVAAGPEILDPDVMGTVVDASSIAHKWLKAGEESVKSQTINFSFLAQAKPPAIGTGEIIELEAEVQDNGREE